MGWDRVGGGKEEEAVGGCNTQNHLKEHFALSFPLHYILYVVADLAEHGEVFNVQLAPQPSKAWCILHLVCALEFNSG